MAFTLLALVIGLGVSRGLFPALAVHVSQKHVVETYNLATTSDDGVPGELYRYGTFGNGGADFNFYTQQVPAIQDQTQLLNLLSGNRDVVLKGEAEGVGGGLEVIRSWDPANDVNGDGKRDWKAWGGLVSQGADGVLKDEQAAWTPDEWVGALFIDGSDGPFRFSQIPENTLQVKGKPVFLRSSAPRADIPWTPRMLPTILRRPWRKSDPSSLDRKSFSKLNFRYRKKAKGAHITVLDDRFFQTAAGHGTTARQ